MHHLHDLSFPHRETEFSTKCPTMRSEMRLSGVASTPSTMCSRIWRFCSTPPSVPRIGVGCAPKAPSDSSHDLGPDTLEVADLISAISLRSAQGPLCRATTFRPSAPCRLSLAFSHTARVLRGIYDYLFFFANFLAFSTSLLVLSCSSHSFTKCSNSASILSLLILQHFSCVSFLLLWQPLAHVHLRGLVSFLPPLGLPRIFAMLSLSSDSRF